MNQAGLFAFKYISPVELQQVVKSVQQKRQDSLIDEKWRDRLQRLQTSHLKEVVDVKEEQENQTESSENDFSSESENESPSNSSSYNSSTSEDTSNPNEAEQPQPTRRSKKSVQARVARKPMHHGNTIANIKKFQNDLRDLFITILRKFEIKQVAHEDESEDAEQRRKVRLSEFTARLRRNYLCTLKFETERANLIIRRQDESSTAKQATLRTLSRALAVSRSALKAFQIQTALWVDFLLKLDVLQEILELMAGLDEALAVMNVLNDEYVQARKSLFSALSKAYVDAELERLRRENTQMPSLRIAKPAVKQGVKKRPGFVKKQIGVPGKKQSLLKTKKPSPADQPAKLDLQSSIRKPDKSRDGSPNAKLLMMKHDSLDIIAHTEIQSAQALGGTTEVETQTDGQTMPLEESASLGCDIYQLAQEVLNEVSEGNSEDRMAAIIEQIICQELI
ncbi:Hypothetical predicted protein [Cloeon dipterum]|uniref:Uncharacterized protein n=1 Tax=Cloeon dipterum TaxID=197152 RepID=A0A8S1CUK1_9INSE|nr:Hypothetical predicted protein [Cloeon dipterum]